MSKLSIAEKIGARLAESLEHSAPKLVESSSKLEPEAAKILEKYNTVEKATALRGPERQAYLDALTATHGDQAKRASDLGFSDETFYHGSQTPDIKQFRNSKGGHVGPGVYLADEPRIAENFGENIYPLKVRSKQAADLSGEGIKGIAEKLKVPLRDDYRVTGATSHYDELKRALRDKYDAEHSLVGVEKDQMVQDKLSEAGFDSKKFRWNDVANTAAVQPENLRSTNAAFDPRFKDSANILALTGQAGKIANKMYRPDMSLGTAFKNINEPMDRLNEFSGREGLVNNISEIGTKVASQVPRTFEKMISPFTSLSAEQTQATNPTKQAKIVEPYIHGATELAIPAVQDFAMMGGHKLLGATKMGASIAEKMASKASAAEGLAKQVEKGNFLDKLGEYASPDMDFTNHDLLPEKLKGVNELRPNMDKATPAAQFSASKAEGKNTKVIDFPADQVGLGAVERKMGPAPSTNYGKVSGQVY
jgi:hypothetical protein